MNPSSTARILTQLWFITVAVLAIAVLYLAKVLLLPLAFAILFAFLLAPVVALLERLRLPRPMAALLVILAFAAVLLVATWSLFTQLIVIADDLPTYRDNIAQKMQAVHSPSNSAYSRAQREIERISNELGIANSTGALPSRAGADAKPLGTTPEHPLQVREVGRPTGRLDQLGGIFEPLTTALLAVVFTFFVLLQREDLRNRLIRLSGDRNLSRLTQAMSEASRRVSRYFLLQVAVNVVFGAIVCLALYFIGLPHAILFAALAALCRFVPYIGVPVAASRPPCSRSPSFMDGATRPSSSASLSCSKSSPATTSNRASTASTPASPRSPSSSPPPFGHSSGDPSASSSPSPSPSASSSWAATFPRSNFSPSSSAISPSSRPTPPSTSACSPTTNAKPPTSSSLPSKTESLAAVYDSILIPALTLVEMERQKGELEESTVRFIRSSTSEMVDELGFRALEEKNEQLSHNPRRTAAQLPSLP